MTVDTMIQNKVTVNKMIIDKMTVDKMRVEEMTWSLSNVMVCRNGWD